MVQHGQPEPGLSVVIGGVRHPLSGQDEWIVGRSRQADLQIAGEQVGRRHVALRRAPDGWVIEDLASLNGLWHQGQRVPAVQLPRGEVTVHLGGPDGIPMTVTVEGTAPPTTVHSQHPEHTPAPDPQPPGGSAPWQDPASGGQQWGQTPDQQWSGPQYQQAPPQPQYQQAPPQYQQPQQPQPQYQQAPPPPQHRQQQTPPQPGGQWSAPQSPPVAWAPPPWPGAPTPAPPGSPVPPGSPLSPGGRETIRQAAPAQARPAAPVPLVPGASTRQQQGPRLSGVHQIIQPILKIGRAQSNEIVLGDLMVSRHHAQLQIAGNVALVTDLNSANGTYVNGHRINSAQVNPGDLITIGPHLLWFDGTQLLEYDEEEGVSFGCANLSVKLDSGKELLHDVSFSLRPRTLLAVVGPSGAGKSTLLHALAGLKPATSGTVVYAGRDLYAEYDDLSQRIGFVPQQDILHQVLTVEQALGYGARLRFPADTTQEERSGRIREVASELSLTGQLGTKVSRLSGGERKRASTAMELLTKPSLLFLDEPTSGLDTDLDREVMQRLRQLADDGRTVVVVTHNLDYLDICDGVLLLARGGYPAYFGPPQDTFAHFGVPTWADVFSTLKTREPAEWASIFASRPDRDQRSYAPPLDQVGSVTSELPPIRRQSVVSQFSTLTRRYLSVIGSDRTLLAILVLLPAVLAGIARAVPAKNGLGLVLGNDDALTLMLVIVVGACLSGAAGAIRELIKERAIYQRERSVGLSSGAYLASKVAVTTTIGAVQGIALTVLALIGRQGPHAPVLLPSGLIEIAAAVALVTAVSAMYGLLLSAAVNDENQAMPLLVLLSMAQLVMCGALVPLVGRIGLEQLSWILPARWSFAATASTVDLQGMMIPGVGPDHLWDHTTAAWLKDMGVLAALGLLAVILTAFLLRRLDPKR
jgi:ABC-type multidrug transport system ATPase subunit